MFRSSRKQRGRLYICFPLHTASNLTWAWVATDLCDVCCQCLLGMCCLILPLKPLYISLQHRNAATSESNWLIISNIDYEFRCHCHTQCIVRLWYDCCVVARPLSKVVITPGGTASGADFFYSECRFTIQTFVFAASFRRTFEYYADLPPESGYTRPWRRLP
ncbi:hypothetical protein DL89DRAFT_26550 [Linderina pennispora]|uniref:Uncharacterized protein n=1 Tax=Linderina pennispora TaxID=61395 RepID=A0A1Y1W3K3_9FUNG|nr:uncharacterized protein DL89DRAFT_26550 [Linderina pennispora]ORX68110.1 hypothetical protein DL89DRAFT_26550 [Linderina pennispora]